MRVEKDGFEIDDDPARLDLGAVVRALKTTYWAEHLDDERIHASFRNAHPFGLYGPDGAQIGCARVVTDRVRFAWLSDLYVDETARGRGLGRWFAETILAHPDFARIDRWLLATRDAHALYQKFGFAPADPERFMVLSR